MSSVVLVVGAGGVGKTTLSAAIGAASAARGERTLVLTVDPARRLADAFRISLGDAPAPVPGAPLLDAAMLDAAASWERIVRAHAPRAEADRLAANPLFQAMSDRFPSGQAYAAAEQMTAYVEEGGWETIVVDTPPSTGGIDFLASPRRMRALVAGRALRWLTGPRVPGRRMVYAMTARPALRVADFVLGGPLLEDVADFLLDLREAYEGVARRSRQVERVLTAATPVVVTTADPAPIRETSRFFEELPEWAGAARAIVFNRALPDEWAHLTARDHDPLDANLQRWSQEAHRQAEIRTELASRHGLTPVVVPWLPDMPATPAGLAGLAAPILTAIDR